MSNFKIPEHVRLHLTALDSPTTFSEIQPGVGLSPVTDLTMNMSGTSLGSTPRRRLSLSNLDNTPTPIRTKPPQSGEYFNYFPQRYSFLCGLNGNLYSMPAHSCSKISRLFIEVAILCTCSWMGHVLFG